MVVLAPVIKCSRINQKYSIVPIPSLHFIWTNATESQRRITSKFMPHLVFSSLPLFVGVGVGAKQK